MLGVTALSPNLPLAGTPPPPRLHWDLPCAISDPSSLETHVDNVGTLGTGLGGIALHKDNSGALTQFRPEAPEIVLFRASSSYVAHFDTRWSIGRNRNVAPNHPSR